MAHLGLQRIMIPGSQVSSLTTGSITMAGAKGAYNPWAGPEGAYYALASVTVPSGGASSIDFVGIPTGYKHLQIKYVGVASANIDTYLYFNSDTTAANYKRHALYIIGDGAVYATADSASYMDVGGIGTTYPCSGIIDILDYRSTTKAKIAKNLNGQDNNGSGRISTNSIIWANKTTPITAVRISGRTFNQNSIFELYGIK